MAEVALDFSQAQPVESPVTLDFTKAQPIPAQSKQVSLDFSKAQPISNAPVALDFTKAQPIDPNARFFTPGGGQATISAYQPSIWDRIKSAVTAGIPNYSSRTIYNPKYGQTQLLSPEEAMTPAEQRAHPMLTGAGEFAGGLTSPLSIALLYGTAGLGELPGAARMLPRLISAGFGSQAIYSGIKNVPAIRDAWDRGDASEVERLLTDTVLNLGMGALAGQHAVTGTGAVTGRTQAEPETAAPRVADSSTAEGVKAHNEAFARAKQELGPKAGAREVLARAQTILTDPTSPIGEVLQEQAPHVRVTDSAAAARDLVEADTKVRPAQETGDRRLDIAQRARIEKLSPEEMKQEILNLRQKAFTSKVTGLPNAEALAAVEEKEGPANHYAVSDVKDLGAINNKVSLQAGDALLKAKADALREAGLDSYHPHGDEFYHRGESPEELTEKLDNAREILKNKTISVRMPDGTTRTFEGADFRYAVKPTLAEAEQEIGAVKARTPKQKGEFSSLTETTGRVPAGVNQDLVDREPQGRAEVTGPSGTAEFRNPTARVVTDDHIPVVSRDEILAQAIHNIISNSGELQRAGVDPSTIKTNGDIDAVLQRASDVVKSNLDPRAEATISFEMQKQLAADLGLSVEQLLARRGGEAYNTEQAIAARALLAQSAKHVIVLAKAAAASGYPTALDDATTALAQHQAIQEKVAGITAEAGRALGGFRIGQADLPQVKIANILSKLLPEAQAEAMRLMSKLDPTDPSVVRKLNQFAEKIRPSTTLDKIFEYYRSSLLSSPHTILVKTASEAAMAAMTTMQKAVAGGLAKFKDSPDRFAAESWYFATGMAQALAEHAKPILSGEFQLEGSPGFERAGQQAIKGALGSVIRTPSEVMSRMTNLLYASTYFGELQSLAARQAISEGLSGDRFNARQAYLAHHPTEAMQESAHNLATTNTFQNELSGFAGKIGEAISAKPTAPWLPESLKSVSPLKFLFPFYKTPVNLLKATLTHSTPYELLNGFARGDTDAMARGVVGSSIAASLAALALSGHITGGGPTDYRKAETIRATAWQPYSLKIGNRYYSYHRFEPVGLAAGMIADAIHGAQQGDSEVVSQSKADTAVKHIMRNLDDMPFMSTLANLLQAVHDPVGGRAQSFINHEAGSLIPAGVANIAETIDPTIRRPQTALQAIQSRIPGLTHAAQPIIDITGQTVQRPLSNLGGANPFPFTTAKNDPVVDELARLGISTPQPPTQIKWRGKPTQLTDAERQQFAQAEGQELYKRVGKLIQSGAWQRRTDDQKRRAVIELHRMIDESRPARLTRIRKQAQADLAGRSLPGSPSTP